MFSHRVSANFWWVHREGANQCCPERKGRPELGLQVNRMGRMDTHCHLVLY